VELSTSSFAEETAGTFMVAPAVLVMLVDLPIGLVLQGDPNANPKIGQVALIALGGTAALALAGLPLLIDSQHRSGLTVRPNRSAGWPALRLVGLGLQESAHRTLVPSVMVEF
jgi:hypothetical protein